MSTPGGPLDLSPRRPIQSPSSSAPPRLDVTGAAGSGVEEMARVDVDDRMEEGRVANLASGRKTFMSNV
jgi:hypothetical protein